MARSEYEANLGLCDRHPDREDWVTAQHVDAALDMLATGADHGQVQTFMLRKLVPIAVQRRVLAGHAARRHLEKKVLDVVHSST